MLRLKEYPQILKADMERQMARPGVVNYFRPTKWCDQIYHQAGGYQLPQERRE